MRTQITVALLALLLAACSAEQLYATGRNAQRAECVKQADGVSRDRCLKDADMSHDTYKKEADAARK
ncbi:MAG: hypothetical protein WB775_04935 [Burkholderiaceae bacterium]|jgi:uncharacterized protein YcfL